MTWTYDSNLTLNKDQVRFLIGDTDTTNQLVQDEEIAWALSEMGGIYSAASLIANSIAATFSGKVDKAIGDLKLKFGEQYERFSALAKDMKGRSLLNAKVISAGSQTVADKEVDEGDTSLVTPFFTRELHDSDAEQARERSPWLV